MCSKDMILCVVVSLLLGIVVSSNYGAVHGNGLKGWTFLKMTTDLPGPFMIFETNLAGGVFELQFKTFVKNAFILYQDDGGISDHIYVFFQNGKLRFFFYLSANNGRISVEGDFTTLNYYNDFQWHTIEIVRDANATSFIVDNGKERKIFNTYGYQSLYVSHLWLGGFKKDMLINDLSNANPFYLYALPINK